MIFTEILNNFIKLLERIPGNLKTMAYSLLFFLSTIEIALTIYNNIDNQNFSYIKWGKTKILKIGFIMFVINRYEWILSGVKSFFLEIGSRGLGVSLGTNNYFNDPSKVWDRGREIAKAVWEEVGLKPSTYVFILIGLLVIIGFFMISIQIIICWVEFYFLTGISIVFLPFGALEMTVEYYKNVFKTIMGASIKLCVFNIWLIACDKILKNLFTTKTSYTLDDTLVICGTVYILVTNMLSMPQMTSGLLTGSPTLNAGEAMTAATGAMAGLAAGMAHMYRGTKETVKGAYEGAKTGSSVGKTIGGIVGGPVGGAVAGTLGGVLGGAGKGMYSAGRYAVFQEKGMSSSKVPKEKKSNSSKNESSNSQSNNSETAQKKSTSKNTETRNNGNANNNSQNNSQNIDTKTREGNKDSNSNTERAQSNTHSTNSSSTGNSGTISASSTLQDTNSSGRGEKRENTKNRLPDWAKKIIKNYKTHVSLS